MPDYSQYNLEELLEARASINEAEFPERAEELDKLIREKKAERAGDNIYSSTDKVDSPFRALPVKSIYLESLGMPARRFRDIPKLLLPGLILVLPMIYLFSFGPSFSENPEAVTLSVFFAMIAFTIGLTLAMVTWHRIVFYEASAFKGVGMGDFLGLGLRFAGRFVQVAFCTFLMVLPLAFIITPLIIASFSGDAATNDPEINSQVFLYMIPFMIAVYYFNGRWSMVFPAAAIGERGKGLGWSWSLTTGNDWRMLAIVAPIPFSMDLLGSYLGDDSSILLTVIFTLVFLYFSMVQISLLSLSYQFLAQHGAEDNNPTNLSNDDRESMEFEKS